MKSIVIRIRASITVVVREKAELTKVEPFRTVLSGDREAIAKLSMDDLLKILVATLTGMSVWNHIFAFES